MYHQVVNVILKTYSINYLNHLLARCVWTFTLVTRSSTDVSTQFPLNSTRLRTLLSWFFTWPRMTNSNAFMSATGYGLVT